jgi:uncharacterized membrane protein
MSGEIFQERLHRLGLPIFSLAIAALGVETVVCAQRVEHTLGGVPFDVIPVIPWLPPVPWIASLFGVIWVACGTGLLARRTRRTAALVLGTLLFLCTLVLDAPKYAGNFSNMSLRTGVLEPLSLTCLAWLIGGWLTLASRYLMAFSLIVFGVDHFLALAPIGGLLPGWIPWHAFWVAFFGTVFIASGLSIGLNYLQRPGAAGLGLMFAIWVLTLHLPRVLGLYGIAGAPSNPNEWSSLFIAVAMWGGPWSLACRSEG